ncbi:hypothetical protein GA0115261_114362 [Streptomyces sp. OspMP-M43]|nr:hypothetical protein GA0115261_114362 [Streptomyces sp. OspMP-M43]
MDGAAPGHGPVATLASALSHLHRRTSTTYKALGAEVGADPSYISRAVSGERVPFQRGGEVSLGIGTERSVRVVGFWSCPAWLCTAESSLSMAVRGGISACGVHENGFWQNFWAGL